MKTLLLLLLSAISINAFTQNVGIGTTTPGFPLSFSNDLGSKISLHGTSGNHYGFGIQGGLFQMYSDAAAANIAFGYGSSSSFTERMRLYNAGPEALLVQGRITLRNGTNPVNLAYGPGIWLSKADNTANLGFMGTQNNQNIGFYGGPAGWGFTYDAINSRVGIGNPNPNAPLSFPALLGRKITFYPGSIGNAGIGVYGNELRIHSDNPNADISFGHENTGGNFTERMRVKGNGAIAVNGNAGNPGEVMQSNGNNSAPGWASATNSLYNNMNSYTLAQTFTLGGNWTSDYNIPGLTQTHNFAKPTKVLINFFWHAKSDNVIGEVHAEYKLFVNDVLYQDELVRLAPGESSTGGSSYRLVSLPAGQYSFRLAVRNFGALRYYGDDWNNFPTSMTVIAVSQ